MGELTRTHSAKAMQPDSRVDIWSAIHEALRASCVSLMLPARIGMRGFALTNDCTAPTQKRTVTQDVHKRTYAVCARYAGGVHVSRVALAFHAITAVYRYRRMAGTVGPVMKGPTGNATASKNSSVQVVQ